MFSSAWIDDLIEQLQKAKKWLEKNGVPDMGTAEWQKDIQYGYKFK